MARPRNADAERTRAAVLDAAIRRFGEHGLEGASLRDIAGDAGVTFATVHHYFGSKQELYDRCLVHCYERLSGVQNALAEALQSFDGTPAQRVRRLARFAFSYALEDRVASRFLLRANLYEPNVPNRRRLEEAQRLYLGVTSQSLAPVVGRDADSLRVPLQGLMYLLTRLAVTTEAERSIIGDDPRRVSRELAEYVGGVAVATLCVLETSEHG